MSTVILDHSPAYVIRCLLIQLGMATAPKDYDIWPVFVSNEPDQPDNCIVVVDTAGALHGRHHFDGEVQEGYGIQILTRSVDYTGEQTLRAIVEALDQQVANTAVQIMDDIGTGTTDYIVYSMNRAGGILHPGRGPNNANRDMFTVNYIATIDQTGT